MTRFESDFDLGDEIVIDNEHIAFITAVCFRPGVVEYQCSWWHNGDTKRDWFDAWRLRYARDGEREKLK